MPKSAWKKTGCFGEIVGTWLLSLLLPQSCFGGKHALLVLLVGGWMQIWPWLREQSNGVSSSWPCHYEILGVSRESDCWGSLWCLLNSNSKECAKLALIAGQPASDSDRRFGGHPRKSHHTKHLQNGLLIIALGNGPKQDWACWKILTPRLEGFVQFYLGFWLHRRGDYPTHMEGQWSHGVA